MLGVGVRTGDGVVARGAAVMVGCHGWGRGWWRRRGWNIALTIGFPPNTTLYVLIYTSKNEFMYTFASILASITLTIE